MSKEKLQQVYDTLTEMQGIAGNLWVEGEVVPEDEITRMLKVLSRTLADVKRLQEDIQNERQTRPKLSDADRIRVDRALDVLKAYDPGVNIGFFDSLHNISELNLSDAQVLELIERIKSIE